MCCKSNRAPRQTRTNGCCKPRRQVPSYQCHQRDLPTSIQSSNTADDGLPPYSMAALAIQDDGPLDGTDKAIANRKAVGHCGRNKKHSGPIHRLVAFAAGKLQEKRDREQIERAVVMDGEQEDGVVKAEAEKGPGGDMQVWVDVKEKI